ncbi:hypothetical protein RF11_09390 [Thelohanellus kitauei]|uniref:Uncharacterized protein n=1 Tax=Thelohanellus kitauei TaxID=669202 RepID=A0A0C2I9W0_THEKT|nr:hypothetical protein RF11_09390 [Thelohanellus kitauei]
MLGLGKKRVKKQKSETKYKRPETENHNLEKTMPIQTSNTHQPATDCVNNFVQVTPIPQDMLPSSVNFLNTEVSTTQTRQIIYQANSFEKVNPKGYSLFCPEQFETECLMNQNISIQGCPRLFKVSHQLCVPNEGVISTSSNLNRNYIGSTEQNARNSIYHRYNNNSPPQQNINVNRMNQNLVNDFSYQYLPMHPASMKRMYTTNYSPQLYSNAVPVTTHIPRTMV